MIKKKGINWAFCLMAIPRLPVTCAKMKDPNTNTKSEILNQPFQSPQCCTTDFTVIAKKYKYSKFSMETMSPITPEASMKRGLNQKVNIFIAKL